MKKEREELGDYIRGEGIRESIEKGEREKGRKGRRERVAEKGE